MGRNRQKLVGQDKASLTEQKTKGNSKNNDRDKENTQQKIAECREQLSPPATTVRSQVATDFLPLSFPQPEPSIES